MSSARERLQKKLEERKPKKEEDRCVFFYEEKGIAFNKADVRSFEEGERLCIRNADNTIGFGTYVGTNILDLTGRGASIKMGTIYTVRRDGESYEPGVDGEPIIASRIGQLKKNGGKKTRKGRKGRSKKTRRA